jgi:hypothetical protein
MSREASQMSSLTKSNFRAAGDRLEVRQVACAGQLIQDSDAAVPEGWVAASHERTP